ncbi:hypothetical protein [Joostella sp.]|uniref:hypothetical protein n=1 Tax=Joostella sp. TaxID=2231138 RepID=UPI003A8F5E7F
MKPSFFSMNKIRAIGLLLVITSVIGMIYFDNDGIGFIAGILFGIGSITLITGKLIAR